MIPNCKNLRNLDLYDNMMSSLDLGAATSLTTLDCCKNLLSALNVTNNTMLVDLRCMGNQIASLDLSKNTKLYYLTCEDNQLTELDVSMIPALSLAITSGERSQTSYQSMSGQSCFSWHFHHAKGDVDVDQTVTLTPADPNPAQ